MIFTKVREVFVPHRFKNKNLLQFLHRYHGLWETWKIQMSQENFCTGIHHFDQWWDSQFLNNQIDSKWKNSSFYGKYTSMDFRRAISGQILTTGRHPKVACNQRYVFLHQHSPFLTSDGTVSFWTPKWTPNGTNQAYLEIILPYLSNDPSRA